MPERVTPSTVAYVLKGYPRLSETFIASEIHRLEQHGIKLKLFVIKPADETVRQPVTERIAAIPHYLPDAGSVSALPFTQWLMTYGVTFLPALRRVLAARPALLLRAAIFALRQAIRTRRSFWAWPRKVYAKEFFQAVALTDRLLDAPEVRHLHAHFCHGATTVAWMAAMMTGLPFSFTAHAKDIYTEALNPAGFLRRKLLAARFAVTCTEANRQYLQTLAPAAVVRRIYHGVNADFARLLTEAALQMPTPSAHPLRLLAVGRLVEKKGFDIFIEACHVLRQRNLAFTAVIAGEDGEHGPDIRQRVVTLGLTPYIQFRGPLRQDELFAEYQRASLFCLPCRVLNDGDRDGIPNVLMEAMACGVPVVTTNISGIPELITNDVNGLLVPPEDATALADAILRVHSDAALAKRLAAAARTTISEQFDGDHLVTQLAALFRQVIGGTSLQDCQYGREESGNQRLPDFDSTSPLPRQLS